MPTALPQSLRGAIGDEAADDLERWFDEALQERAVPRDEYREVLSRLDVLERDVGEVKSRVGEQRRETGELRREMNERFDQLNARFDQQSAQFDQRFDQMGAQFDQRFDQMGAQFDQRFDQVGAKFDQRLDGMNERFDRMHEQMRTMMRWTIGTIALIGVILSALLAIAEFAA